MAFALIFFPLLMAALAAAVPSNRLRPWLLPVTAAVHLALTVYTLMSPERCSSDWSLHRRDAEAQPAAPGRLHHHRGVGSGSDRERLCWRLACERASRPH